MQLRLSWLNAQAAKDATEAELATLQASYDEVSKN